MSQFFFAPTSAESVIGKVREGNEDAAFISRKSLVVADGMGGHVGGEVAAQIAVRTLIAQLPLISSEIIDIASREDLLLNVVYDIDQAISKEIENHSELEGMGTTLSSLVIIGDSVLMQHIGDSRCYRIRKSKIEQLSIDHTVMQELLAQGRITHDEIADHPQRSFLTQALMGRGGITPVLISYQAEIGDIYLVCSDGLTGVLSDSQIRDLVLNSEITESAKKLVERAYERGAPDNVTVLVGRISETSDATDLLLGAAIAN